MSEEKQIIIDAQKNEDGFRIYALPLLVIIDIFAVLDIIVFFIYNIPTSATYNIILQSGILFFQFSHFIFLLLLIGFIREYWCVICFLLLDILAWILYLIVWIVFIFSNLNQMTSEMIWKNILLSRGLFMIFIDILCFIYAWMLLANIQKRNKNNQIYNPINKDTRFRSWYRGVIPSVSSYSSSINRMEINNRKYNMNNNSTKI